MFFIAGASGFIGRHLIGALQRGGCEVRCLVRTPEKASACERAGFGSAVGDITDRESLRGVLDGCSITVHLVGIIEEKGDTTFERVHVRGTENLVSEAKKARVKHFFYQSALGASAASSSNYLRTKAQAEELVKASGIPYTIFRPSLVVGEGDGFTARLKDLIDIGPVVPIPGNGATKFQPMYVGDWSRCFTSLFCPSGERSPGVSGLYEIGGPEHLTYNEIIAQFLDAMGVRKPTVHVPLEMLRLSLPFSGISRGIGALLGKKIPSVTREQLDLLQSDNICDRDSVKKNFGFVPMTYGGALKLFVASA
ncbi:MAG TPA: NAD(P)H-binding protein [Dissulfurispiraceae bacterium]